MRYVLHLIVLVAKVNCYNIFAIFILPYSVRFIEKDEKAYCQELINYSRSHLMVCKVVHCTLMLLPNR